MVPRAWRLCLTVALGLAAFVPASWAGHGVTEHASTGPADTNGPNDVFTERMSEDGSRTFFETQEQLVPEDQDGGTDVYEYRAGGVQVVSTGPTDPGTATFVSLEATSADGTRVFFKTNHSLVPEDTDSVSDVYERHGNVTTLVSTGDVGGNGEIHVCTTCPVVSTPDGSHVFFFTTERLVAADIDSGRLDVYERTGGVTRLVSTGPNDGPVQSDVCGSCPVIVSDDGTHVAFVSGVAHLPEGPGIYKRSNGTTTTRVPGSGGEDLEGLSRDGSRIWFGTDENGEFLCEDEFETEIRCRDVFEYSGGTVTNLSGSSGNGFFAGATPDGTRVFFQVDCGKAWQQPCPMRLLQRHGGTTSLVSNDAEFVGASDDGARVFFNTRLSLVPQDSDTCDFAGCYDVYERSGGVFTLVSTGPAGSAASAHADGLRASPDGGRVAFATYERLMAEDTDSSRDIYTRAGNTTALLSHGPAGGNGPHDVHGGFFGGISKDAARVVFRTWERLAFSDEDDSLDVYVAGPADTTGHSRPAGASPFRASLVPAFNACTAPNRTHGPPLAFGSCAPPTPSSSNLKVGVGDTSSSIGFVRFRVIPGDPAPPDDSDVQIQFRLSNVMRTSDLSEYTGELRASAQVRLTDRQGTVSQTTVDFPLEFDVPCVPTASTGTKSLCELFTTLDAVTPGAAAEGTRGVFALDQMKVHDGGPDEDAGTTADNSLFAVQGLFIP